MHPPCFFFLLVSFSVISKLFFLSQSTIIASFHHWPLEQEKTWQTAMNALYLLKERMHEENNSFIFFNVKVKNAAFIILTEVTGHSDLQTLDYLIL